MGNSGSRMEAGSRSLRWGIVGCANIAGEAMLSPASRSVHSEVFGICARSRPRAEEFARKHSIPNVYDTYEDMLKDERITCIYIPSPNSLHASHAISALRSGKHILIEKPLASNEKEAREIAEVKAEFPNLVAMEAFHYRYHPAVRRYAELVKSFDSPPVTAKVVLDIPRVFLPGNLETDIRFDPNLAGGTMMDLGCYAVDILRNFFGDIQDVTSAKAAVHPGKPSIDLTMDAEYTMVNGCNCHVIVTFVTSKLIPTLQVHCEFGNGSLSFNNPLAPHMFHSISMRKNGQNASEKVYGEGSQTTYAHQLNAFAEAVLEGKPFPTDLESGITNMKWIDQTYRAAGLPVRSEK